MSRSGKFWCLLLALGWLASPSFADAQRDRKLAMHEFKNGRQMEKERRYASAIAHYKAALTLVPGYFWAHKQIGYCHYALGNYDAAATSYQRYLEANPKDDKTRYFLYNLQKQIVSGKLNQKLAPKKTGREIHSAPYLSLTGGGLMVSDSDAVALFETSYDSVSASSLMPAFGLEAGYLFKSGFYGQVTVLQGLQRTIEVSSPKSPLITPDSQSYQFTQSAMMVQLGWLRRFGKNGMWGLQGGVGPSALEGPGGTSGDSVAWMGEGRVDWLLGNSFAAGLRLGYFSSTFNDFKLEHAGPSVRLVGQWFLFPVRK